MAQAKPFSLILLYEKVASALPVAQALKEKDIDVVVVQNAGELIQTIATRKFDMVGLSVNHSSCTSLIRVLKEKTQVQIMAFGEDKNITTGKKIDKADVDIKISGIANGYNIFMKIGHLVKKKEKESENARSILLTGGGEKAVVKKKKGAAFIVKGKAKTKKEKEQDGPISVTSARAAQKADVDDQEDEDSLAEQLDAEGGEDQAETLGKLAVLYDGVKENDGEIKEKSEVKKGPGALIFRKKDDKKSGVLGGRIHRKIDNGMGTGGVKQKEKPGSGGLGGTIVFSDDALAAGKQFEKDTTKDKLGKVKTDAPEAEEEQPSNVIDFQARKKKAIEEAEQAEHVSPEKKYEQYRAEKQAAAKEAPVAPMAKLKHKKQFRDAVHRAGENVFQKSTSLETFGSVSRVCIVPVLNPKEKGFLLFCTNDNQFLSKDGLEDFKLKLYDEMKDDAVGDFILGETFNIDTFEVDIGDWAEKSSQFAYGFQEGDGPQVFVCFVKRDNIYPEFKQMEEPTGVYRVHIHTMPPLTPVTFNVFLYFVKNRRLIPYLKKGGKFTARQIQRLYKRGFKFLYIAQEDRSEFLNFYISLAINQDFQSAKSVKLA